MNTSADSRIYEHFHARRKLDIYRQSTCSVSGGTSPIVMDLDVVRIYASTRPSAVAVQEFVDSEVTCEGKLCSPPSSNRTPTVSCILRTGSKLFRHLAEYRMVVLDQCSSTLLGEAILLQDEYSRRLLHDVCMFSHSANRDQTCTAVSVGVTASIQGPWDSGVVIQRRRQSTWTVDTFPGDDYVIPCFDFNPASTDILALAGVKMKTSASSSLNIIVYDTAIGRVENERSLSFLNLDDCDDKQLGFHYSPDGHNLLLDVREQCGYVAQLFQVIYILNAHSLCTLKEVETGYMLPCHLNCWSFSNMFFSNCSSYLFVNVRDKEYTSNIRVLTLPPRLNLKHQCRVSVIRRIKSETDILLLPIPGHLQQYLTEVMPGGQTL